MASDSICFPLSISTVHLVFQEGICLSFSIPTVWKSCLWHFRSSIGISVYTCILVFPFTRFIKCSDASSKSNLKYFFFKVSSNQAFWHNHELEVTLKYLAELRLRRQNFCYVPWRDLHESLERWNKTTDSRPVKSMGQSLFSWWNNYCRLFSNRMSSSLKNILHVFRLL